MYNVLLVDDDLNYRKIAVMHLKKHFGNVKIFEAINPVEALSIFENHKDVIHYIFCDFYLPIQNGNDFVEIIKKNNKNVYVCLVTGDDISQLQKYAPNVDQIFSKLDGIEPIIKFMKNNL